MKRVIVESPYSGDVERNVAYARICVLDCLGRGEAPIASHLLFPGILDDDRPAERELGILAGQAWIGVADLVILYIDYGITPGMEQAMRRASKEGVTVEYRRILGQREER